MSARMIFARFLILLLLQIALFITAASQTAMDSLKIRLNTSGNTVSEKAILASRIAEQFMGSNLDSARYYSAFGLHLSLSNNFPAGVFKNSCILGKTALAKDSINSAIGIFERARKYTDLLEDKRDALCVYLLLGYAYDMKQDYFQAHEALYSGLKIAEDTRDSMFLYSYFNNLGVHYMAIKDYSKSHDCFQNALQVHRELRPEQVRFTVASIYSNLGVVFINLEQPDSAEYYLRRALAMPEVAGNFYGLFNLHMNLGLAWSARGEYDSALYYYQLAGMAIDSLSGHFEGTIAPLRAGHYCDVGKVYFQKGDLQKSKEYLQKSLEFSETEPNFETESDAYLKLSEIAEKQGDIASSLKYLKKYLLLKDILFEKKTDEKISRLTLEYEFEQKLKESRQKMELAELRSHRKEIIYLFIIVTVIGILISLFLLYRLQRNKARRKHLEEIAVRLEKEKISEELDYKNKELTTNVLYLLKKNEFILSISQKLREVIDKLNDQDTRVLRSILNELENTSSNDTWDEFEVRFKEVHTQFYNRLSHQFPDLTAQDLRLCAFLRLNMTNKEIAAITFQSLDSLKTARYRLRKKLGMDRDDNLVAFLTKI
jgi:tetratricopeptide (TPR) repeat protein